MHLLSDLEKRNIIYQSTSLDKLRERLDQGPITVYMGSDPTADSLHVGNLFQILTLRRFQLAGHKIIALVGGGTALIGDPGGRSTERTLNPSELVSEWSEKLRRQLSQFLDFDTPENPAVIVNNYDWIHKLDVITFLRDIGKNFSINTMLAKESVSSRLENGISFTEFSYMVLQGYGFLHLYQTYGCELQIGGSDQWGNLTAGTELIRKVTNQHDVAHAITTPLITKKDGTKFGKTGTDTVWLSKEKTSPYAYYQFWLNMSDEDVIPLLYYYTFLSHEEIERIRAEHAANPSLRMAQTTLAKEMTLLTHGPIELEKAEKITNALFNDKIKELSTDELQMALGDVPSVTVSSKDAKIIDILIEVGAATSKRVARELITNGALQINDQRIQDIEATLQELTTCNDLFVIRRGKKNYYLCKVE